MLENYRNRVGAKYFGHSRSRIETPKDRTRIRRGEMLKTYRNQVGAKYFSHSRLLPRLCAATQSASFKYSNRTSQQRTIFERTYGGGKNVFQFALSRIEVQ
ncbi:uncharacterized protein LOC143143483 isoform X2 [Ptiloglossa arizonensis]|uniref:uncharacterized protein LOC143143483 isoform X2 n=1 Tax=Ptiloglossa arizonensis TaxID=3350558 RepID=UPI003F9FD4A8